MQINLLQPANQRSVHTLIPKVLNMQEQPEVFWILLVIHFAGADCVRPLKRTMDSLIIHVRYFGQQGPVCLSELKCFMLQVGLMPISLRIWKRSIFAGASKTCNIKYC